MMRTPTEFSNDDSSSLLQTDDDLNSLWGKAKAVEMSEEERDEQRINHVFANMNLSDPRISIETVRATHELVRSVEADTT